MRIAKCSQCGAVIELDGGNGSRQVDKSVNGYLAGSKGDFIAGLIQAAGETGIAKIDLQKACLEKFGNDSLPRINHVIYDLRKLDKVVTKDGKVCCREEEVSATDDATAKAKAQAEADAKVEADQKVKAEENLKAEADAKEAADLEALLKEEPKKEAASTPAKKKQQGGGRKQVQKARDH